MKGYIRIYRQIVDSDIYKMPPLYLRVFGRLLIEANHTDTVVPYRDRATGKIVQKTVKRGEHITSIRQICSWVAWYERRILREPNPRTIAKILNYLEQNNMLTIYRNEGNRSETHYKVCNYEVYQASETCESNGKVTPDKQSVHTNKNEKEYIISSSEQPAGSPGKAKKAKDFDHESKPYKCAAFLDAKIRKRWPDRKPSDEHRLQSWAKHFDAANRLDGNSWELIGDVLAFSQQDPFWSKNILSGEKFRKQFDTLRAHMSDKGESDA